MHPGITCTLQNTVPFFLERKLKNINYDHSYFDKSIFIIKFISKLTLCVIKINL